MLTTSRLLTMAGVSSNANLLFVIGWYTARVTKKMKNARLQRKIAPEGGIGAAVIVFSDTEKKQILKMRTGVSFVNSLE